ncbi:MAG: hypothetical protein HZB55_13805 [Deltaproteobacteria bacterium]|nr:hypothetical protein [Deltaproteobacteria bacterium]
MAERVEPESTEETQRWQRRLLPFMIGSILAMGLFFFAASFVQLSSLRTRLAAAPVDLGPVFAEFERSSSGRGLQGNFEYLRWKTLVRLEQEVISHRYDQSASAVLTRVWTRYLGFVTGMILALTGAVFILGKLREAPTKLETKTELLQASLYTSSPGIVLAVLGTVLMSITLTVKFELETRDVPTYVRPVGQPAAPLPLPAAFPGEAEDRERALFPPGDQPPAPASSQPAEAPGPINSAPKGEQEEKR